MSNKFNHSFSYLCANYWRTLHNQKLELTYLFSALIDKAGVKYNIIVHGSSVRASQSDCNICYCNFNREHNKIGMMTGSCHLLNWHACLPQSLWFVRSPNAKYPSILCTHFITISTNCLQTILLAVLNRALYEKSVFHEMEKFFEICFTQNSVTSEIWLIFNFHADTIVS